MVWKSYHVNHVIKSGDDYLFIFATRFFFTGSFFCFLFNRMFLTFCFLFFFLGILGFLYKLDIKGKLRREKWCFIFLCLRNVLTFHFFLFSSRDTIQTGLYLLFYFLLLVFFQIIQFFQFCNQASFAIKICFFLFIFIFYILFLNIHY